MTLWKKLKRFPPCLVRLLATDSGVPRTSSDIASRMGTSEQHVDYLSMMEDWSSMDVDTMERFLKACGCDFEDTKVHNRMRTFIAGTLTWPIHRRDRKNWEKLYSILWTKTQMSWRRSAR
jgi:hypothetical protein